MTTLRTSVQWCLAGLAIGCLMGCSSTQRASRSSPTAPVKVLIIGDSISMHNGYFPALVEWLGPAYKVVHNPNNGGDSGNVLKHLDEWIKAAQPDVIHFNCGLHDIKRMPQNDHRNQIPPWTYEHNLRKIAARLTRTNAKLIFGLTTPVNEKNHSDNKGFVRQNADVDLYNRIARRVMNEYHIPINDLHAVINQADPATCLKQDGVHMNDWGNTVLAEAVTVSICSRTKTWKSAR